MIRFDGKLVSQTRRDLLKPRIQAFEKQTGRAPHLVVVLVGENPASQVYVRNKQKSCEALGMRSTKIDLPANTTQKQLNECVLKLNQDNSVDGILVQLPLPQGLHDHEILEIISPLKDVDAFSYQAMGHLWAGKPFVAPCTPTGVMSILSHYKIDVSGMNAVVVGRSNIVGKPMAHLLTEANATVTICHSKTKNLRAHTVVADLVVVAAGKRHFLGKDDFKKDAIVIDVGMHGTGQGNALAGDVRFDELEGWAKAATPVPGGVGPMTITTLLENTVELAERRMLKK